MTSDSIHVLDDEPQVLKSLGRLLAVAGFDAKLHASAQEFLACVKDEQGGCVLLDYEMPGFNGIDLQALLAASEHDWQVIFISGRADIRLSVQAMKQGAVDFLVKPSPRDEILAAVRRAIDRHHAAVAERAQIDEIVQRIEALSPRERQVMGYVIAGRLNKQIADLLGTAEKTVKIQRSHLMQKMGVKSVAELVRLTEKAGVRPLE
jgi:FixJ family two-component response regulator